MLQNATQHNIFMGAKNNNTYTVLYYYVFAVGVILKIILFYLQTKLAHTHTQRKKKAELRRRTQTVTRILVVVVLHEPHYYGHAFLCTSFLLAKKKEKKTRELVVSVGVKRFFNVTAVFNLRGYLPFS